MLPFMCFHIFKFNRLDFIVKLTEVQAYVLTMRAPNQHQLIAQTLRNHMKNEYNLHATINKRPVNDLQAAWDSFECVAYICLCM